ncbi:hypothetical protein PENTCL1PPCAC_25381, partial [Pristionchus entomophagus]
DDDCYDFDAIINSDGLIENCMKVSSSSTVFEMAETECAANLSSLASIHSKQANDFIRRKSVSMGYSDGVLIGGSVSDDGTFSW